MSLGGPIRASSWWFLHGLHEGKCARCQCGTAVRLRGRALVIGPSGVRALEATAKLEPNAPLEGTAPGRLLNEVHAMNWAGKATSR